MNESIVFHRKNGGKILIPAVYVTAMSIPESDRERHGGAAWVGVAGSGDEDSMPFDVLETFDEITNMITNSISVLEGNPKEERQYTSKLDAARFASLCKAVKD